MEGLSATSAIGTVTVSESVAVDVTLSEATTAIGSITTKAGAKATLVGVSGETNTPTVNVWGIIDDSQSPSWTVVTDSQSPSWTGVSDSQSPEWQDVA